MPSHYLTAILLVAAAARPATAQLTEVQPGARVRVAAPGLVAGKYEGTVLARTSDTLVLGSTSTAPVRIAIARLTSLEISRGSSRSDGALRGMLWGVPIMTALGVAVAVSAQNCRTCAPVTDREMVGVVGFFAASGALYGAGIGALIGRERWESFQLTPSTAYDLRQGRLDLAFKLRL